MPRKRDRPVEKISVRVVVAPLSRSKNFVPTLTKNTEAGGPEESTAPSPDFRPLALRQSVGLVERRCSESEMLHYLLQAEASRQELERAAQRKSDFLAAMSHEIRTPLNGIIGMTAILLAKKLDDAERDCVEIIRNSGEALLSIIDEILDFSKIEAGQMELECAEFELAQALQGALQIVTPAAARKSIRLLSEIDPAIPRAIRGDLVRLRQVLLNLLSNAVKFSAQGNVELNVTLAAAQPGEYELRFTVTDQGIGIGEHEQARLFQPFRQADASTTRKFGGTGLGLAISKRLVELMGGTIGVNSRPGHGSSFWFTIKALPSSEPMPAINEAPTPPLVVDPAIQNFRILLVEDNGINQKVALLMLKGLGYRADTVANGIEALAAIASKEYDLVLMDCLMPQMDGFETTRRIRAQSGAGSQVPIVAMTANAFAKDREECLAAGMSDFIPKPVRREELRQKLAAWLPSPDHP